MSFDFLQRPQATAPMCQAPPAADALQDPLAAPMCRADQDPLQDALSCKAEPAAPAAPFAHGGTRGDLVWAVAQARPDLGLGKTRDEILTNAEQAGVFHGRPDDVASRAEAAAILVRALGLGTDLPEGEVAYFTDVSPNVWFFEEAHAARRFGLFRGDNGANTFRGDARISADEARVVANRAATAHAVAPKDQVAGTEPVLQPFTAMQLLEKDELSADEIKRVRDEAKLLDDDAAADVYHQLAGKTAYRNQRDNAGEFVSADDLEGIGDNPGDVMCNMTSMAMALNTLGLGVDESTAQMEDQLDATLYDPDQGGDGSASRYSQAGQRQVAEDMGASTSRLYPGGFASADEAQQWFEANVTPELRAGASATMGIRFGKKGVYPHIVRLEWVEGDGLTIDDPYGAIQLSDSGRLSYDANDTESSEGEGAVGANNHWSWDIVAAAMARSDRYVQVVKVP